MLNKKLISYKSSNNSRNHYNSKKKVINLVNYIYDDEFVSLINNLSSSLKDYFKLLSRFMNNLREITSTLGNQTLYSKCLLNECLSLYKNNNTDKIMQLSDRIYIIDNNKKLLNNNISLIDVNMQSFLDKAKILFKKMKIIRNNKLNNLVKKQKYNENNKIINKNSNNNIYNEFNYNINNNDSYNFRKRRYYSSNNNMRYNNQPILNQNYQNFNCTALKKNKTSKIYSKTLVNNNNLSIDLNNNKNDYINYNRNNSNVNDRKKTISFNLRKFLFKSNKSQLDNPLENSNESFNYKNTLINMRNTNNSLLNYCSLINNGKAKNNRNINTKDNIKYKNISSFSNDISNTNNKYKNSLQDININKNVIGNSIYDYKHCWNKTNLELKNYRSKDIQFIPNYFNSINYNNKEKEIIIDDKNINIICYTIANKIIEYFMLLNDIDSNEENKYKLKSVKKNLINICLNIINKINISRNENNINLNLTNSVKLKDNNHINELKNNYLRFSKNYNKGNINNSKNKVRNDMSNEIKKENIFRNIEEIKIYNSVGNMPKNLINSQNNNINIIGNNNEIAYNVKNTINYKNNIIDLLNHELKKKNECIKKMNNLFKKNNAKNNIKINMNEFRIMNPIRIQLIPKKNSKKK